MGDPSAWRQRLTKLSSEPQAPPWNLAELDGLIDPKALRPAAVLLGLVPRSDGWQVLLTLRTEHLASHAGQVSFPGGRVEADEDVVAAALRETSEEVGIGPELITPLGFLERFATISNFAITPVVALLDPTIQPRAHLGEVAAVFEAPLCLFRDLSRRTVEARMIRGKLRSTYVFEHQGQRIWGATAAILVNFIERVETV